MNYEIQALPLQQDKNKKKFPFFLPLLNVSHVSTNLEGHFCHTTK